MATYPWHHHNCLDRRHITHILIAHAGTVLIITSSTSRLPDGAAVRDGKDGSASTSDLSNSCLHPCSDMHVTTKAPTRLQMSTRSLRVMIRCSSNVLMTVVWRWRVSYCRADRSGRAAPPSVTKTQSINDDGKHRDDAAMHHDSRCFPNSLTAH